jgi:hypothetical protein
MASFSNFDPIRKPIVSWTAAGSEAPRRFVIRTAASEIHYVSKAVSSLRSATAVHDALLNFLNLFPERNLRAHFS